MRNRSFIQKFGGYVIDAAFCLLSIWAVLDYFYHGRESRETIQAAFALVALYAFGVIWRVRYVIRQYEIETEKYKTR